MKSDDREFRELVHRARREAGLSLRVLGQRAGLSPTHLSRIENGRVQPELKSVLKIANALGRTEAERDAFLSAAPLGSEWNEAFRAHLPVPMETGTASASAEQLLAARYNISRNEAARAVAFLDRIFQTDLTRAQRRTVLEFLAGADPDSEAN